MKGDKETERKECETITSDKLGLLHHSIFLPLIFSLEQRALVQNL